MTVLDGIFLEEVMLGKNFLKQWVNEEMQTVKGGQVCINVIGTRAPISEI